MGGDGEIMKVDESGQKKLTVKQKKVIELVAWQGLSQNQAAKAVNLSKQAVSKWFTQNDFFVEEYEKEFMQSYNKMLEVIKPSAIICYGTPFKEMKGNVVEFLPTTYEWTKNLSWQERAQFEWEKHRLRLRLRGHHYLSYW